MAFHSSPSGHEGLVWSIGREMGSGSSIQVTGSRGRCETARGVGNKKPHTPTSTHRDAHIHTHHIHIPHPPSPPTHSFPLHHHQGHNSSPRVLWAATIKCFLRGKQQYNYPEHSGIPDPPGNPMKKKTRFGDGIEGKVTS